MTAALLERVNPNLPPAESQFRGSRASVNSELLKIDRAGGNYDAGIMRGVSLISLGEALGHEAWIDEITLRQVAEFAANESVGVKSRFTHPSMSSDGTGRLLGRLHDVRVDGDRVIGDLHFAKSAHSTPDGDLAEYVMMLAEEDPRAAGLSIVFMHDSQASQEFAELHQEDGQFRSPDGRNKNNYPHVRVAELRAADVVDEPAANPDGLFDRQPLARNMDDLLSYAVGLSAKRPAATAGFDADRAKQFVGRWLESHGLELLSQKELAAMADQNQPVEESATPVVTRETLLADQQRYVDRFGSEDGVKWFSENRSFEDALGLFADKQAEQIEKLETELSETKEKIESFSLGESEPVETQPIEAKPKKSLFAATDPSNN